MHFDGIIFLFAKNQNKLNILNSYKQLKIFQNFSKIWTRLEKNNIFTESLIQ